MNNVYLIGFMGCGKSTIAKNLAEVLNRPCLDLDQWIERQLGRTIPELFHEEGEVYFRDVETYYLQETANLIHTVVSTGGGAVGREINRQFLKKQTTIYLEWPFEVLYKRIAGDTNRPLSKSYDQLLQLYEARRAFYEESAVYTIKCQDEAPYVIVRKVLKLLQNNEKKGEKR